ncbi:MAG: D-alanine--D-alanine ligase [Nitrospiraceae bacterium]|nr:MAG: D-alanine--D-alanine ligase [Nitrospiraceae bacterium]
MTKGPVTRKRIGVLMGGLSGERDVSIRSGLAVYQGLEEKGYNTVLIDTGKDLFNQIRKEKIKLAFLALHGGTGENGAIQGMLDVLGIPYTGSGILASALAMDKEASKKVFSWHGLSVAPFVVVMRARAAKKGAAQGEMDPSGAYRFPETPRPAFELPWVVKPSAEGSSIGVSIIKDEGSLRECLEKTFAYGPRLIIEKYIKGREIHIGVLGERVLGGVEVRPSTEFYNYEAKYTSGMTEYIIPPEIDNAVYENLKDMALRAHCGLGCSGATRVDFIVDEQNRPFILEVNTLPGMTATSLLPKIAGAAGLTFNDLIEEIIRLAVKEKD